MDGTFQIQVEIKFLKRNKIFFKFNFCSFKNFIWNIFFPFYLFEKKLCESESSERFKLIQRLIDRKAHGHWSGR